ncbi:MAG TPA: SDR family oxidoreductase [Cytophagales bacterium]|nr:SDR family oxidoreductase [Cytophagales bacterium]
MNSIQGKVILVTGAGQGLGAEIAKTVAADGATIIACDVKADKLDQITSEIRNAGGKISTFLMDVTDEKNVEDVLRKAVQEHGKLDVLVNNAGIDFTKSVEDLSIEEWDKVIKVNLRGPFILSKLAFPYLLKSGQGHIVNIVSTASKRTWSEASAYHASKWGFLGFSHALHVEARQKGIKVTAVIAGGMKTPFILERFPEAEPNLQDPKNVADTVKFVLTQPAETVIPEVMVIPMRETSWP